jgi:hypothetical protein
MVIRGIVACMVGCLVLCLIGAVSATAQTSPGADDMKKLVGKWRGYGRGNFPGQLPVEWIIREDGSFTGTTGSTPYQGRISISNGKISYETESAGPLGGGRGSLSVSEIKGKPVLTGAGEAQRTGRPSNFELNKVE